MKAITMGKSSHDALTLKYSDAVLRLKHGNGARTLSFKAGIDFPAWRKCTLDTLSDLLGIDAKRTSYDVVVLRKHEVDGVIISVVQMRINDDVYIPAYFLEPKKRTGHFPVMAIHGHGEAEACIGLRQDYHHGFALFLAQNGYTVLCPELRGFGVLKDMARDIDGAKLDYWNWGGHMAYSLVSEANLHGKPLIGQTVEDLLAWEDWLLGQCEATQVHVTGISYGGDLALLYPTFSHRTRSIFASGTLGSFSVIFSRCYNAPAHTIPAVLKFMDRSDIAGLNAPTPIAIHYGDLDQPSPKNHSASFNQSVPQSMKELQSIYAAAGAQSEPQLLVTAGKGHEMDNAQLLAFIQGHDSSARCEPR